MQNISNDSSFKKRSFPEVEVLLATHNGQSFVGEFLKSLSRQRGVKIHLRVSDDGSTDKTLQIVDSHKNDFESCEVFTGPGEGPSANFFFLIEKASYEYIFLADQDDIWEENKLLTQLWFLEGNAPQLVCHDRSIINSCGEKVANSQTSVRFLGLGNALIENVVFGNTILMNKQGVDLVRRHKSSEVVMYDSFIYLLFSCFGQTTFIQEALTRYRIHDRNFTGIPNAKSRLKNFRFNTFSFYRQNLAFFQVNESLLSHSDVDIFMKYFQIFDCKNPAIKLLRIIRARLVRQSIALTAIWKFLFLFYSAERFEIETLRRSSSI